MDGDLLAEIISGPGGFLVVVAGFLWLGAKEIRKARAERVVEAEAEAASEREKRIETEAELRAKGEAMARQYWRAREMLISQFGVRPEDLP